MKLVSVLLANVERELIQIGDELGFKLPLSFYRNFNLKKGDRIEVWLDRQDGKVRIHLAPIADPSSFSSQETKK